MTQLIASLDQIADQYDAVLCDIWGVIHNGREVFAAADAALRRYRERGGIVVLVSNVPKPRDPIPGQLLARGASPEAWDAIVTSGDAIRAELEKRAPGPFLKIGPEDDDVLWDGLNLEFCDDLEDAEFIAISGLEGVDETPQDYLDLLEAAQDRELELLCANPDIVVRMGDQLVWCAGAVAAEYEKIGGTVIMAGKPFAPIYELALAEVEELSGGPIRTSRILAIGDGIMTDLKGAAAQGLDALFIASGMHGEGLQTNGRVDPAKVAAALAAENVVPRYLMPSLS
jgi:HAD superfamily hydrolase (TIGR01459 family)